MYCQDHVPYTASPYNTEAPAVGPNPYAQATAPPVHTSPGLAFVLGWIPGVGAIYNGQYLKGLVHAIIFGLLISLGSADNSSAQPLFIMTMVGFVFYMPFEAYHTAKKRQMGVPVDEWSSLLAHNRYTSRTPIGPIILILIGVLFLLDTLRVIEFRDIARFWPVILIAVGAYMLYNRMTAPAVSRPTAPRAYNGGPSDTSTGEMPETGRE